MLLFMKYILTDEYVKPLTDDQKEMVSRVFGEATMSGWKPNDQECHVFETIHGHIVHLSSVRQVPDVNGIQRMGSDEALALTHMMDDCRWVDWSQGVLSFGVKP